MVPKVMDSTEKKRIANEKRLKAVKQWKKNQTVQNIKPINSHKIFDTDDTSSTHNREKKPQLFDCEDEEDGYEECFKVHPQFEGPHGQELLEMSSQFSERFKLDERFREDEPVSKKESTKNDEKEKNIKILQSVLGYEVTSKSPDKSLSRKLQIRFDPEDESASKYVKVSETQPVDKSKKQKKSKKQTVDDKAEPIPISTERYIEVSSNLKEILSATSAPFIFSQSFNQENDLEMAEPGRISYKSNADNAKIKVQNLNDKAVKEKKEPRKSQSLQQSSTGYFTPRVKTESFFIKQDDPRLKEGVEFFKRPKSMEEIRVQWSKRREYVLELFRRKQRSSERSFAAKTKVQAMQRRNLMRKQYFKK